MPPIETRDLPCPNCNGVLFVTVVAIQSRQGGGTVLPPKGLMCVQCHTVAQMDALLRAEEIRLLEAEMAEKRQRLASISTMSSSSSKNSATASADDTPTARRF
jgi:hypothetical protein